ncbi:MAG: putative transposase, YhgA-like [bacterium ADurb.Bin363]|nr:MAG: putative transposase, YhgA-like [bacterium ADurb.Bin363]
MVRFLKDFIYEEWVEKIEEENLEQLPNEYIKLIGGNLENDIVYKIHMEGKEVYVYFMLEHQSKVNFLMPFRVLEYMTRIWRKYIDDTPQNSINKEFLLPPIYPVIFYDGIYDWTAEVRFENKVKYKELFIEHIPKFSYGLVNLNNVGYDKLNEMADGLALILALDKIKNPDEMSKLKLLKEEFWEKIKNIEGIQELLEVLAEVMRALLTRINVDKKEVEEIIEKVRKGEVKKMFEMAVEYDVQAARAEFYAMGIQEGLFKGKEEGIKEGIKEGIEMGLDIKFGDIGIRIMEQIRKIDDITKLEVIKEAIKRAKTIDEVVKVI